ncbi:MAG: Fe-S cluster assembly protein SufD [Gemmatimonadetes bacterium]|nr:Fe-S cluster assembly protein SufD [Gemmatimonadota bacterium]
MSTTLAPDLAPQADVARQLGPDWLLPVREAALAEFSRIGWPTTRNEDWHYTNPSAIAEGKFVLAAPDERATGERRTPTGTAAHGVTVAHLAPYTFGQDWPLMVFVNGRFAPMLSRLGALQAGVRVTPLAEAMREDRDFLEARLGTVARFDEHAFTALNTAFMTEGAVIHVAKNVEVAEPLHLVFIADEQAEGTISHPRVIIAAEPNAKVTVIESWGAVGTPRHVSNVVTEVDVASGATVTHLKMQRESAAAFHVGTVQVNQAKDSHFVQFTFQSGAQLMRSNIYTHLNGPGCGSTLNGLVLADGTQHLDTQTRIEHVAPRCYSRELYKGVLDGEGHGVFNGKVYVHPEAQQTDGKQENHTILLSDRAQIDTKPQLEIFADDVKCTHGATVGRLDQAAEFYMKSRGISAEHARRLLVYAFAADVLETIENEVVRTGLEALVLERFAGVVV